MQKGIKLGSCLYEKEIKIISHGRVGERTAAMEPKENQKVIKIKAKEMYKSNERSRLLSQRDDEEEKRKGEKNKRKMKYDFVCKSDPVSHINNRKTTTQDKKQQ